MSPSGYTELSGEERYGEHGMAGDLAEAKVSQVLTEQFNRPPVPFGPRRVNTKRAQHTTWHAVVRHAPDFLGFGRFIEVQGCNGERVIVKKDKLDALIFWNGLQPVWFGIYNQADETVMFADLPSVLWAAQHPESTAIVLDAESKYPKEAWEVPLRLLREVSYHDAFEAVRVEQGKRKRKPQGGDAA
jgi:hypothetical protein